MIKKLQNVSIGISAVCLALIASFLGQIFSSTHAANTLTNTSSQIISVATTDGLPPNGTYIGYSKASGDGNVVLFSSNATNLPNSGPSTDGLYTYNIRTNTTARVDLSTSGAAANDNAISPNGESIRLSETGRYVTFISKATNLVDGTTGTPNYYRIFIRDMQTGVTTLLSERLLSGYPQNYDRNLAVSNDGRFVLLASRYVGNSYPYYYSMSLGDKSSGTYSWTSLSIGGVIEGGHGNDNTRGSMSCDGAFVAFNQSNQIKLADIRKGSTITINVAGLTSASPIVSCSGRYVLYATTNRTDITPTPSGMNSSLHLVRYDRITGERIYIDSDSTGVFSGGFGWGGYPTEPPENVFNASISDSGDVVFKYNGNMYLKHLSDGSGTLEPIAITTSGTYVNTASYSQITQSGNYIFFSMDPYNLGLAPSPSSKQIIRVKTNL